MTLKDLKLKFQKKQSSSTSSSVGELIKETASDEVEETEVTLTEEDEAFYGYNTFDDVPSTPTVTPKDSVDKYGYNTPTTSTFEDSDNKYGYNTYEEGVPPPPCTPNTPKMSRRSSLKGSSPTPRQFRRHSLTFSSNVVVATIIPTPELAKKKSLWFEDKDYEKMHKKIHLIAERAQEGEGHKYCTRGLENIIRGGSQIRKYAAWDAVLDEQEYQIQSGAEFYDEDALSRSYRVVCEESRAQAAMRALQDQKEAAEYLSEKPRRSRRSSIM
ncbi:unnamed protein product [Cylindrotheca closterium]|uniref:Uncharacterized protein n=1 Tax=Cylindrotheca closterium TaxID=2856 RepID=A0AAD2FYE0_9STRA|nr:unnamed protein product [Cylindrotheca closterium]